MATLLELATIEENAVADPGEPPNPDIVAAHQLRSKIRTCLYKKCYAFIAATPEPEGQTELEQVAFSQAVLRNPEAYANAAFRVVLSEAPDAATPAQILNASDTKIFNVLTPAVLSILAYGIVQVQSR